MDELIEEMTGNRWFGLGNKLLTGGAWGGGGTTKNSRRNVAWFITK